MAIPLTLSTVQDLALQQQGQLAFLMASLLFSFIAFSFAGSSTIPSETSSFSATPCFSVAVLHSSSLLLKWGKPGSGAIPLS
jgi:hypothetical protein